MSTLKKIKKKRILILGPDSSYVGGIATFIEGIVRSDILSENYDLFTFNTGRPINVNKISDDYSLISKIGFLNLLTSLVHTSAHLLKFPFILVRHRPDIVHVNTPSYLPFWENSLYVVMARVAFRKTVIHIHGGRFQDFYEKSNNFNKFFIRSVLRSASKVIVLSPSWKKFFSKIVLSNNLIDIPNFVKINSDTLQIDRNKDTDKVKILFIGGSNAIGKGLIDVAKAIPLVITNCPAAHFNLVACDMVPALELMLKERSLINNVTIRGIVHGKEKNKLFWESDIFILPSYAEGLPITMLEAMAAGLPVIASSVGAIPDVIEEGKNGFLIKAGDYKELVGRIVTLVNNPKLREYMAQYNLEKVKKHYNVEASAKSLNKIYKSLEYA